MSDHVNETTPTTGAYFLAKVYHEAYERAEVLLHKHGVGNWDSLSSSDKHALALGMQILIDANVVESISLNKYRALRRAGWKSCQPKL